VKRPDLLLLIAIWEFITAFGALIGISAIAVFVFPDAIKDTLGSAIPGVIFGLSISILVLLCGSVPNVVEKGIGISYPIGKPTNKKGGHTDEERIPQGTGIDHVRTGVIAGRACRPTAGAICP